MPHLPPLTVKIASGAEGGHEFERLMNQLLLRYADRHDFEYEPAGGAGGDSGIDGRARSGGVPGIPGPAAFQFKWLWGDIHKGDKARQVKNSLERAATDDDVWHWILVTPHDLTPAEKAWLLGQSPRSDLAVHHWGHSRLEGLLRDYCPALFARYYPQEAASLLAGYDGCDFSVFAADYRERVAISIRRLRTIGLPPEELREQDARTEIPLRKVFVPQTFRPVADLERSVSLADLLRQRRSCVLLGDPGMGKTTALSFVALLFCGEADLPEFTAPPDIVPLLIPLRDFLKLKQTTPDLEFVKYLECHARCDLSLRQAHGAFFEATLRMGEAIVLVDGLDEAGGDVSRHSVSLAIQTFRSAYPQCPLWVTSRVYGYTHDVRLPTDDFSHYRVGRLEPLQIDDFVERWYAIQYPENERERQEQVNSLQNALRCSPGVQRLAGNPLLLTLMAFIHYGQRTLPQDRGELYEKCIQMLLKSWLEAKRKDASVAGHDASHGNEIIGLRPASQRDYLAHLAMSVQETNQSAAEDEARGLIGRKEALDCLANRHRERSYRTRPDLEFAEAREEMEQFLEYIIDRTGLLIDKGGDQLAFIHLSFQEYLAAWLFTCVEISETEQRRFFETHLGDAAWEEVLLLRLYIYFHLPGGRGEELFDAVVNSLLRKLEREADTAGWLTLARAVRDKLEFSSPHRRTILQQTLDFWLESPPRFDGNWFNVLDEVCLFAPDAKQELKELLEAAWRYAELARAVACLHLLERLGLADGSARIDERKELVERISNFLVERSLDPDWRGTLSYVFDCVTRRFGFDAGVKCLRDVADRMTLPPVDVARRGQEDGNWKTAIVMGDCLGKLAGGNTAIPEDLANFFRECVVHAIKQEIVVKDRHTLGLALGRIGDSRIMEDLRVRTHPDEHPGYVRIPEGRYCVGEDRTAITFDKPFWLSKYPVTNSQFALFIDDDGYSRRDFWSDEGWQWVNRDRITAPPYWGDSRFNAPNQPVTAVTFWEAEAFCTWAGGRLPKLEQWEAGACGQHGFSYPWGNEWHDGICNSRETALGTTSPVGIFPRSRSRELGLEDMAGNVWEWCDSIYEEGEVYRVLCGGAFNNGASACMSDHYSWDDPRLANFNVGFRISTCL